ncbi:MAG: response regulator [SAR324 cluster bacterium]|nr:response regulator [SAR324 cluster bacterium]
MTVKVLITDDSPSMRSLLAEFLSPLEVEIILASNGEECVEKASHLLPDLITLDIQMPGINGITTCSLIKKLPNTSLIPIMMITSVDDDATKTRAFEAGAIEYVVKPFSPEYLRERVTSILQPSRPQQFQSDETVDIQRVLVAEDTRSIMAIYKFLLPQIQCELIPCEDGQIAWNTLQNEYKTLDLIVSDINMPNMNGIEFVTKVRGDSRFDQIPIIMSTTVSETEQIKNLLQIGVNDYIIKPFSHEEFNARVSSHLRTRRLMENQEKLNHELHQLNEVLEEKVRQRTREIRDANVDTIFMLALASDAKDKDTANHVRRVRFYSEALATKLGYDAAAAEEVGYSSMMHDVGKIAIPDNILNKPGKLTDEEWVVMRTHTTEGAKILGDRPFFFAARQIANFHHERYDGTGYPKKLKGEDIPMAARIVTVADVYDALCSRRVYKEAWDESKVIEELRRSAGSHLDPAVVEAFLELVENGTIDKIREQFPN